MLPCSMLSSQSSQFLSSSSKSPHLFHSMTLTLPLFSYSYALFGAMQNAIPIPFNAFRTHCSKHGGWVTPCAIAAQTCQPEHTDRPTKSSSPFRGDQPTCPWRQLASTTHYPLFTTHFDVIAPPYSRKDND